MAEILHVLKVNSTLKTLSLSVNSIGVDGAKSLAILLCHNHTLEHLYISNNRIMDDGVIAISECFKISSDHTAKLTCIKLLDLSANCLTSQSKTAISTIIQEGALKWLNYSYNELGESGAYEISKALQTNLTLQQLFLSSNSIGVNGALSIAVALCHNHTLEELDISKNGILDDGAIAITECLKANRTLKCLDVSHNNITEIGATEIVEVFKSNSVFEKLNVNKNCVEMLKPYIEQLLYNENVGKYFCIEVKSSDLSYQYDQDIALIRVWTNNEIM